jgi:hypothetical protein
MSKLGRIYQRETGKSHNVFAKGNHGNGFLPTWEYVEWLENRNSQEGENISFKEAREKLLKVSFARHIPEYGESMLKSFYDILDSRKEKKVKL